MSCPRGFFSSFFSSPPNYDFTLFGDEARGTKEGLGLQIGGLVVMMGATFPVNSIAPLTKDSQIKINKRA